MKLFLVTEIGDMVTSVVQAESEEQAREVYMKTIDPNGLELVLNGLPAEEAIEVDELVFQHGVSTTRLHITDADNVEIKQY